MTRTELIDAIGQVGFDTAVLTNSVPEQVLEQILNTISPRSKFDEDPEQRQRLLEDLEAFGFDVDTITPEVPNTVLHAIIDGLVNNEVNRSQEEGEVEELAEKYAEHIHKSTLGKKSILHQYRAAKHHDRTMTPRKFFGVPDDSAKRFDEQGESKATLDDWYELNKHKLPPAITREKLANDFAAARRLNPNLTAREFCGQVYPVHLDALAAAA